MISEKKKITIAIFFVLIFTLSTLIAYEKIADPSHANDRKREHSLVQNGHLTSEEFFSLNFSDSNTVFLIGSSHLGSANVTTINQIISKNSKNPPIVYNLAAYGDSPEKRLKSIDKIIETSPKVIFYQISYRDFQFIYEDEFNILPIDFKEIFHRYFLSIFYAHIPLNPQELLFSILRPIQNSFAPSLEDPILTNDKTPFFHYVKFKTKTIDELKSESSDVKTWNNPNTVKQNVNALKQIIVKAQKNNIKVVIFTSPLHDYFLQTLSEKQKNEFLNLLDTLEIDHKLKIYDFQNHYKNLHVWKDIHHISYHDDVKIYNEEIAKMILEET